MTKIIPYTPDCWADLQTVHDPARMQELTYAGLTEAFMPLSVAAEREGLFQYSVYVARQENQTVGFVAFTDEELAWLYVHPDFHRRGIGRALAEYALAHMAAEVKTVEVLAGNEPARSLYRSLGFTQETHLYGHMPGNEEYEVSVWQMTMK